jgi:hypothetical protein
MKIVTFFCRLLFISSLLGLFAFNWPVEWLSNTNQETVGSVAWLDKEIKTIKSQTNIDTQVLKLSLVAYANAAKRGLNNKSVLTVIDYSKPSTEKRLWVFDLRNGRSLFNTWVSHGKNSGGVNSTSFSNSRGSLKSSIGVFVTDSSPYIGGNGYSLRLKGLENGVNDNAYQRSVVIHGAWYVNADVIRKYGQIGRSWGCPAVSPELAKTLIDTIKENTLVFAYYPDQNWLRHSKYLTT